MKPGPRIDCKALRKVNAKKDWDSRLRGNDEWWWPENASSRYKRQLHGRAVILPARTGYAGLTSGAGNHNPPARQESPSTLGYPRAGHDVIQIKSGTYRALEELPHGKRIKLSSPGAATGS